MAYTGTGTENDPYIVSTFTDFLTCFALGDYIKIAVDLDAAAEGYEYIEPIMHSSGTANVHVFADSETKIKNVTVQGSHVLGSTIPSSAATLEFNNIYFQNICLKSDGNYSSIFHNYSGIVLLTDCKVSVAARQCTGGFCFADAPTQYSKMTRCAFDVTMDTGTKLSGNPDVRHCMFGDLEDCNVVIRGEINSSGTNSTAFIANYPLNVAVVLKDCKVSTTTFLFKDQSRSRNGYICFDGCTADSNVDVGSFDIASSFLVCINDCTNISESSSSAATLVTSAQLKDETYLQSIGWLP